MEFGAALANTRGLTIVGAPGNNTVGLFKDLELLQLIPAPTSIANVRAIALFWAGSWWFEHLEARKASLFE